MPYGKPARPVSWSYVIPKLPGMIAGSVSDFVPLVWILFPLQPGYTMTVCACASGAVTSDHVATMKAISVRRNMLACRCRYVYDRT